MRSSVLDGTRLWEPSVLGCLPTVDAWDDTEDTLDIGVGVEIEARGLADGGLMDPSALDDAREDPMPVLTRVLFPRVDILIAEEVRVGSEDSFR